MARQLRRSIFGIEGLSAVSVLLRTPLSTSFLLAQVLSPLVMDATYETAHTSDGKNCSWQKSAVSPGSIPKNLCFFKNLCCLSSSAAVSCHLHSTNSLTSDLSARQVVA